ncbi:MAG TPA: aminoacyl-tRNA hydrolase [Gammaproteobacteria bacterium]|nr:aminoacyl-tRNA hydrolase [Gammaproteobacteria bacterium]
MESRIRLIVGLGNPGPDYAHTRHNAGFWLLDELVRRHGGAFSEERKFHGDVARTVIAGHDVRLLKPMTYMNRSGLAVQAFAAYLKVQPQEILVVHDEIDLPVGVVRLKWSGGHGGHNGLRDVSRHLGEDYRRLRIGVGKPQDNRDVIDYVLKRPTAEEQPLLDAAVAAAADAVPVMLRDGFERAMQMLHSRETVPKPYRKTQAAGEGNPVQ